MSEFKVIPVVRYIVTHHYVLGETNSEKQMSCTDTIGEFPNEKAALRVCDAMVSSGQGVYAAEEPWLRSIQGQNSRNTGG